MTTPTHQACAHDQIQSWHFDDGTGHAGMWSCKGCGLKFVPITESMAARAQALDEAAAINSATADKMEREAQAAHDNGEHDEVDGLRASAWILTVCAADIQALKGKQ